MIWKTTAHLTAVLAVAGLVYAPEMSVPRNAQADIFVLESTLDKRKADRRTRSLVGTTAADLKGLAKKKNVYIDLKVRLDGKTKYAVMSSQEDDQRRYHVDCHAGAYGRLPMGDGTEYYVKTDDKSGKRVDLSFFPGSRSMNPDNDVSCVADPKSSKSAILRIRGIYKIITNDYGDRLIVELRPLTRASLSAEDRAKLP